MKNNAFSKPVVLPNLLITLSSIILLLISILARTIWEWMSIWRILLAVSTAVLFLIPNITILKDAIAGLSKAIPLFILAMFLIAFGCENDLYHGGTSLPLFGISLAFLVFSGKGKGIRCVLITMLYTAIFAFFIFFETYSCFLVFIIVVSAALVLSAASATGWLGSRWKWLKLGLSLAIPLAGAISLSASPFLDYVEDLMVSPYPVIYLDGSDPEFIREHLAQMSFWGRTALAEPAGPSVTQHSLYESRMLVILGHRVGWCVYVLMGLLLAVFIFGLILSAKRRKGLGRLLPLAAIGTIALPIAMLFLTNLGVFEAHTSKVPLLTDDFTTNLFAILLLRLSITYAPDPESYTAPGKDDSLIDAIMDEEYDDDGFHVAEGVGELRIIHLPENDFIDVINAAFSDGQIMIPFKRDIKEALKDKALLLSRYSGDLCDIINIFDQIQLHGKEHFIKITVSEESNYSQFMRSAERVTHALSDQQNVDYSVCIDDRIPKRLFSIQVVSTKSEEEDDSDGQRGRYLHVL